MSLSSFAPNRLTISRGELRGQWLREIHPNADVLVIDDRYDENDTAVWAANTIRWLNGPPDAVFTSEDYGEPYARAMGCMHVSVDPTRTRVPCSATMIRADPYACCWDFIQPAVRGWFAKRVCVLGADPLEQPPWPAHWPPIIPRRGCRNMDDFTRKRS